MRPPLRTSSKCLKLQSLLRKPSDKHRVVRGAGMNLFLKNLDITFRRDPTNYRPRINKMNSVKDQEQKSAGSYYYLDDE